ncbi:SCO family protein [Hyphococcus sp.]|uniref:SCO family protein n=1 Tax=Hyphococcus sp. TaxID=2038636 RepID=UPI0035C70392
MIRFLAPKFLATGFILLAAACSGGEPEAAIPKEGVIALSSQFTGDFDLVDKAGQAVADEDFEGKVMLVYFGFTNCPDVCPGDIGVMSAALNELGDDADEVAAVFISVDPERDTPQALTDYFAFDQRITPLTGSVEAAEAARRAYKLVAQKEPLPDSAIGYTVNHGRFFYINDRNGQPQHAIIGGVSPQELAALLRREIRK